MSKGVEVVGLYVRDQDEALAFYVEKLGFRVHTDSGGTENVEVKADNGEFMPGTGWRADLRNGPTGIVNAGVDANVLQHRVHKLRIRPVAGLDAGDVAQRATGVQEVGALLVLGHIQLAVDGPRCPELIRPRCKSALCYARSIC